MCAMRNSRGLLPMDMFRDYRALGGGRRGELPSEVISF